MNVRDGVKQEMREAERRTKDLWVHRSEVPVFVGNVWGLKRRCTHEERDEDKDANCITVWERGGATDDEIYEEWT